MGQKLEIEVFISQHFTDDPFVYVYKNANNILFLFSIGKNRLANTCRLAVM